MSSSSSKINETQCCCKCVCTSKTVIKQKMDEEGDNVSDLTTPACSGVIPPTAINVNCVDMKKEWRSFRNGFEFYEFASGLRNNQDNAYRVANLLTIVGKETFDIFHSLKLNKTQKSTVNGVLDALEMYFDNGGKVFLFILVLFLLLLTKSKIKSKKS